MTDLHQLLHDRFGFSHFRGVQQQVVERTAAGQSTLAIMPTGAGKSLTYQLGALARRGTGIVISPLIALMHDQVRSAEAYGIRAAALTSLSADPRKIRDAARDGQLDLLYVAPERATTGDFQRLLEEVEIALFAIDEAHCVSEWGHDFRPDYRLLLPLLEQHRDVPRLALTATADRRTREDILVQLGIPAEGEAARWRPQVMQLSALKGEGIERFWALAQSFRELRSASGEFEARRRQQALSWMWDLVRARLQADFQSHPAVRLALPGTIDDVQASRVAASTAARALLGLFEQSPT